MTDLYDNWNVWIYEKPNNWSKNNLKIIFNIKTIQDFIAF